MRKILALAVVALMALAAPALAEVDFSGAIEYTLTADTSTKYDFDENAGDEDWAPAPDPGYELIAAFSAGEEGLWSLSGETADQALTLDTVTLKLTPPEFTLTATVNGDIGEVEDPFEFVTLSTLDANKGIRIESSYLGPTLLVQFDDTADKGWMGAKAEMTVAPVTVGVVSKLPIPDQEKFDLAAYAKATISPITVTGGFTRNKDEKTGFAGKAEVKPIPGLSVSATYKKDTSEYTTISSSGTYDIAELQPGFSVSNKTDKDGNLAERTISGTVKYRASAEDPAFADLFDDDIKEWHAYAGIAALASVKQTADTSANAALSINAKVTAPLMPSVAAARVYFTYEADEDGAYEAFTETATDADKAGTEYSYKNAKSHILVDSALRYALTPKFVVGPTFKLHSWSELQLVGLKYDTDGAAWVDDGAIPAVAVASASGIDLGANVTYNVTDAASLAFDVTRETRSFDVTPPAGVEKNLAKTVLKLTASVEF